MVPFAQANSSLSRFLSANITCGIIGFIQAIFIARSCGPVELGIAAVISSITPLIINLLDIRLPDLALAELSKIQTSNEKVESLVKSRGFEKGAPKSAIIAGLALTHISLALAAFIVSFGATYLMRTVLFEKSFLSNLEPLIIATACFATSAAFAGSYFIVLQRLSISAIALTRTQIFTAVLNLLVTTLIVSMLPTASGIVIAAASAALLSLLINVAVLAHSGTISLLDINAWPGAREIFLILRAHKNFLFAGNLYGYVKALHRGADILIVSLFCPQLVVGLYKFARGLTDNASIIIEALQRQYMPAILILAQEGTQSPGTKESNGELKNFARRSMRLGLLAGLVIFTVQYFFLNYIIILFFGAAFAPAAPAVAIFTIGALLMGSVNIWLWPWTLAQRQMGLYARAAFIGTIVGQYGLAFAFFYLFTATHVFSFSDTTSSLIAFALGHTLVYPIHYWIAARTLMHDFAEVPPHQKLNQ